MTTCKIIGSLFIAAGLISVSASQTGAGEDVKADLGNLYPYIQSISDANPNSLSYLSKDWPDVEAWRTEGRAKVLELLGYNPKPAALKPEILETVKKTGYTRCLVRYWVTEDRQTEAYLLVPEGLHGPAPAVVALHDHGGFYYYGKEKITETENQPKILKDFIEAAYGGRCYADELARQGFVVLAPDAFYFGSQRLVAETLPAELGAEKLKGLEKGSDEYIRACNKIASVQETLMAKTLLAAGTTWSGVFTQGDRAAVDYLLTRPEVDGKQIGCMGLSGGGFRSTHLFGLDGRVKAAVVAGFMPSYNKQLFNKLRSHTWMIYTPRLYYYMDYPDIVTLNAPQPLMVLDFSRDGLFPMGSMKAAEAKIAAVYTKMGAVDKFRCNYYDTEHAMMIPAQDDGIAWLKKWLMGEESKK